MNIAVVAIIFVGAVVVLQAGYERRLREVFDQIEAAREQSFFNVLDLADVADQLAAKLEIEADGGDNPADFVRWAIRECWRDADRKLGL